MRRQTWITAALAALTMAAAGCGNRGQAEAGKAGAPATAPAAATNPALPQEARDAISRSSQMQQHDAARRAATAPRPKP